MHSPLLRHYVLVQPCWERKQRSAIKERRGEKKLRGPVGPGTFILFRMHGQTKKITRLDGHGLGGGCTDVGVVLSYLNGRKKFYWVLKES